MAAEEILRFALYKEVVKRTKRKKRKLNNGRRSSVSVDGSDSEEEAGAQDEGDEGQSSEQHIASPKKGKVINEDSQDIWKDSTQDLEAMNVDEETQVTNPKISPARYVLRSPWAQ